MYHNTYKLTREQVDVEAIAQEIARYLKITAEDTEYLSYDPTRRDAICAELDAAPGVKSSPWANQFVAEGQNPDDHLVLANAAIAVLTPPKSLEDRAKRLHIAFAALMVFKQYKVAYALVDHPDLEIKILQRQTALMNEWYQEEYPSLFPDRAKNVLQDQEISTPPNRPDPVTPPVTRPSATVPKAISPNEVAEYLSKPHMLLGKRFDHSPPQDEDQENKGTWEAVSYTVQMVDGDVDHEYQIMLEELDGDSLPMGREEVQFLLTHSTLIA